VRPDKQTRVKVCWTIGKNENEEKLPFYDDTNNEDYLRTLIEFCSLLDDYEELQDDGKASIVTRMFKKILKSSAKMSFIANIKNLEQSEQDTYEGVKDAIKATSREILGYDAC